jgi:hypothetical protein
MQTEKNYAAEFLLSEGNGNISRANITLAITAFALAAGTLLAVSAFGAPVVAAKAGGNIGNGALTMDAVTPLLAGAKVGVYSVRCVAAAANGGTFEVQDPEGFVLGNVAVGAAFADDVKFAIADGATDFVVGDGFDITVSEGSGQYVAYDEAKAPTMPACAVLYGPAPISAVTQRAVAIVRQAEVAEARLTGLTAAARKALATRAIIVR